jgi:peptide/nickel transport system permease protein
VTVFLTRRLGQLVLVLWGALTVVFGLMHLGGDPVSLLLPELATPEQQQALRRELGVDRPLHVQYVRFLGRAAGGDFGVSYRQERPVLDIVLERLPATLELSLLAAVISAVAGTAIGVLGALWRGRLFDRLLIAGALLGQSVPTFWLGILLILVFSVNLRLLPTSGNATARHFILPAVTLAAFSLARTARIARSSMIEVLAQDYIRTARAKGVGERGVVAGHALKNAAIPVVTVTGFTFSTLIGGAIITEAIFAWPGLGSLIVDSVLSRDYPIVLGAVFMTALFVAVVSLVVDVSYALLDPRIKFR